MAVNMVTLPEPESGKKRPKLTTPKYGAFAMVLSAEQYRLWLLWGAYTGCAKKSLQLENSR